MAGLCGVCFEPLHDLHLVGNEVSTPCLLTLCLYALLQSTRFVVLFSSDMASAPSKRHALVVFMGEFPRRAVQAVVS